MPQTFESWLALFGTTAAIVAAVATLLLALVTFLLVRADRKLGQAAVEQGAALKSQADATQKLAESAIEHSKALQEQAAALASLAQSAAKQLDDFRAEARAAVVPVLRWELTSDDVELRPMGQGMDEVYLVIHCRLRNYGAPAILRQTIDTLENSISLSGDPRRMTPPVLLPTGEAWDVEFPLGPISARLYPSQHLKVKVEARPQRLIDELRPVICELLLTQRGQGYSVEIRSTSGWQP